MPRPFILAAGLALVVSTGGAAAWRALKASPRKPASVDSAPDHAPAVSLAFRELIEPGPALRPSAKAVALNGKRVRIVGFMAEMEEPMSGAFYLVGRPIKLDESGGGTGDLPLESILIEVPGTEGKPVAQVEGALVGTGVLEVGNRADDHGRVSNFRLKLDPDDRLVQAHAAQAASSRTREE